MTTATVAKRSDVRLPAALSLISGVTDVISWLLLGGLFTAHVTGNLVLVAADVVTGTPPRLAAVLAIPVFVVTTVVAAAVARRLAGHDTRTERVLLGAQALLLVIAAGLSFVGHASSDPQSGLALAIGLCAVGAMASQNAYLHLALPKAPSTAVMTGNLVVATIAAFDLVTSRGRSQQAREHFTDTWPLLAGFIGGCLVGAAAATLFGDHAAVVPAVLAVAVLAAVVVAKKRADHA